ncbi:ABC transporter ATP-binding protein/permease [Virgibacillus pantothenticus]|uniref:ABC transporter ATP-binding protein n=1 Tax=Virgibacillus pantothenticus TaxID=1473 RepID=UPI001C225385|nr:ABC transporter ATP-binding protein [Virgibacillus pantothenticus]MBU8565057.1 ABC transporter ATP-binding protein/permease [Virgibacillus pantothenticus]MBU8599364.1 ABC transporter ATP-binding protein/permease [Virgibacillus pantothenticus]MBU8633233.1 ABC transporter ATP-binding protein/permease [Virgibacillus pantothenticus]MBU8641106.1 ABC transporter ATP-binding protein/permease [Virgibacillus pantothenticus]MBU8644965.1 ABC transporter ATP-binding protein/permease [Virgibacillus pant
MDSFKKLKQYYWPYKKYFLLSLCFLFFVTVITVIYPIILQQTIDRVVLMDRYELIPYICALFLFLMIGKGFATFYHQYLGDLFGITAVYKLRDGLYHKLQRLSFTYYDNAKTGDIMSRLTADVEGFRFFLSFGFAELLRIVLLITISLGVMFYFSVPLALVTMAAMPFLAIIVFQFDKRVHPAFRLIRQSYGKLNTRVQENISGMHTVKSLSREDFEIGRFAHRNDAYRQHYLHTSFIWSKYFPLMEFIGNFCAVALLAFGGYLVIDGQLSLGALVAFFSLVWYIMGPLMNLGFVINQFSQAKASAERLLEILEAKEDIVEAKQAITEPIQGHVTFQNVTLTYVEEDDAALKYISFDAPPGKVIGLIGSTGSGKTSITQLITRFYEPQSGDVFIDQKPVSDYQLKALRKEIGFVLQEPFLFSTTIRENIAYGNPDVSDEQVIDAAKRAQAHEFIMKMPDGYQTLLGERGMGLSGGQKQCIAIARAICINPKILILDDATSAVDMETEFRIQKALREVMKGRTSFIIAHRIASLKHADEILVLEDGKVVERGTHDFLIKNEGPYQRIYDIQYQDRDEIMKRQHA